VWVGRLFINIKKFILFYFFLSFLILFIPFFNCARAFLNNRYISFNGWYRFSFRDDKKWRSPQLKDSSWRLIKIPGGWKEQGIKSLKGIYWYRIHFKVPTNFHSGISGIYITTICDAEEVYVNGIKIGGEGKIGKYFVVAPYVSRVYRIPNNLLKYNHDNLLAIRVMNLYFDGGINALILGDYRELILRSINEQRIIEVLESAVLTTIGLFILGLLFLYLGGAREKDIIYFFLMLLIYAVYFFIDSLIFYKTGLKNPFFQKLSISLACIWFVFFLLFLIYYFDLQLNKFYKSFMGILICISVLMFLKLSWNTCTTFLIIWTGFVVPASFLITIHILIQVYRTRKKEAFPIFIGVIMLVISGVTGELLFDLNISCHHILYLQPWDYGMFFFLISVMYGIVAKFIQVRDRMRLFASKILVAQEEERKRLARELHDGLGQDLLVTKFNLQSLNQQLKSSYLKSIIKDINKSIKELRNISMGLRPAMLEELGIQAAIKSFTKEIETKIGIHIDLALSFEGRLPIIIEENLFRIFQEALNNIMKHSCAKKVKISLSRNSDILILKIEDNGIGFSFENKKIKGLGLDTMAERTNLIGANLKILSTIGKGTRIIVEVPLNDKGTLSR